MPQRYVRSCCDVTAQPGVYYRQGRKLSDNSLVDQWFPVTRVPPVAEFRLYDYDIALCLKLLRTDAESITPGTICRRWDALVDAQMESDVCGAVSPPPPPPANQPPVNTVPGAQVTDFETALNFGSLISVSDPDAGASPIRVTLTVTHGTLTLSGLTGLTFTVGDGTADATMTFSGTITNLNNAINGLVYNPATGYSGAALLTITTNDLGNTGTGGALTDTDTVAITVGEPANDAPVNTVPGAQSTPFDTPLDLGDTVSIADPDAGGDDLQVTLTVTHGTLTLGGVVGLAFTVGDGTNDATMTFTGTIAEINTAMTNLTFTPTAGYDGVALFTIHTDDQGNNGTGGAMTDEDTVEITVLPDGIDPCTGDGLDARMMAMDIGDDILESSWVLTALLGSTPANHAIIDHGGRVFQITFASGVSAGGSGTCATGGGDHFVVVITRVGSILVALVQDVSAEYGGNPTARWWFSDVLTDGFSVLGPYKIDGNGATGQAGQVTGDSFDLSYADPPLDGTWSLGVNPDARFTDPDERLRPGQTGVVEL